MSPMDPILMNLQECHLIDLLVFSDGKADGAMTGDLGGLKVGSLATRLELGILVSPGGEVSTKGFRLGDRCWLC